MLSSSHCVHWPGVNNPWLFCWRGRGGSGSHVRAEAAGRALAHLPCTLLTERKEHRVGKQAGSPSLNQQCCFLGGKAWDQHRNVSK